MRCTWRRSKVFLGRPPRPDLTVVPTGVRIPRATNFRIRSSSHDRYSATTDESTMIASAASALAAAMNARIGGQSTNHSPTTRYWANRLCSSCSISYPPMIVPSDVMAAWFGEQAA